MINIIELNSANLLGQRFRKHLLYPTELRGLVISNIFQGAVNCEAFCHYLQRGSLSFITFHKNLLGNQWEKISIGSSQQR